MRKILGLFLLCHLLMTALLAQGAPHHPIELLDENEIHDIEALDTAVNQLSAKMRQCVAAGLAPATQCHCLYPRKLASAKAAYFDLLAKYPNWAGRAVLWWDLSGAYSSNLHMGGLKHTIGQPCNNIVSKNTASQSSASKNTTSKNTGSKNTASKITASRKTASTNVVSETSYSGFQSESTGRLFAIDQPSWPAWP